MNKRPQQNHGKLGIEDILHQLNSRDPGAAWTAFIDHYSGLIMRAVRQFEFEQERQSDCFMHVCEKLCENGFRRLLKYNTKGSASFTTWLGSVVHNLCVDWHRAEYGRATMLPAISALPIFDQSVFRLYFEQAMDRESCRRTLEEEFPGLTQEQMADAIARVHRLLTSRQRWSIATRRRHRLPSAGNPYHDVNQLVDPGWSPEREASEEQRRMQVQAGLARLSSDQRLILQLRYEQGLTLDKVSEVLGLGDPYRARRAIDSALNALAAELASLENMRV